MLFSEIQKVRVKRFLGYSTEDTLGIVQLAQPLNDRLNADYSPEFIAEVQVILANLIECEEQIIASIAASRIVRADVITFDYGRQAQLLTNYGSSFIKELANLLGVAVRVNKFANSNTQISLRSY